jgi:hypothetical protein
MTSESDAANRPQSGPPHTRQTQTHADTLPYSPVEEDVVPHLLRHVLRPDGPGGLPKHVAVLEVVGDLGGVTQG